MNRNGWMDGWTDEQTEYVFRVQFSWIYPQLLRKVQTQQREPLLINYWWLFVNGGNHSEHSLLPGIRFRAGTGVGAAVPSFIQGKFEPLLLYGCFYTNNSPFPLSVWEHAPHPPTCCFVLFLRVPGSLSWVTMLTLTECCTHVGAGHSTLMFQGPVIQSCLFPSVPLSSLGISLCVNLLTQGQESQGDQQEGDSRRKSDSYRGNFWSFFPGQYNEAGFIFSVPTLSYLGWKRKKRGRNLCSPCIKLFF